jgi:hypothetical protein
MKIETAGFRTDLEDYFANKIKDKSHTAKVSTPFVVITKGTVKAHYCIRDILKEHPATHVFQAWVGQWHTDVFYYRVRDLRKYVAELSKSE